MTIVNYLSPIFILASFLYIWYDCPFFDIKLDSNYIHASFILLIAILTLIIIILIDPISCLFFLLICYEIYMKILPINTAPLLRKNTYNTTSISKPLTSHNKSIECKFNQSNNNHNYELNNTDTTLEENTVQTMYYTRPKALSSPTPKYQAILPNNNFPSLDSN